MLIDRFGRNIDYLRISVTDRCNYRCIYCMPETGIVLKKHDEILDFESIVMIADKAAGLGLTKIRLTGGEPLVRKKIEVLVGMLGRIEKIRELSMTTNAVLLTTGMASTLKEAGLSRVNISLDTLDPEKFRAITRGGDIGDVLSGITAAREAGLDPVKINMIIFSDTRLNEVASMRRFCKEKGLILQTIKHFSLYNREDTECDVRIFDRPGLCGECNRLRLTADGCFKPCLFSDNEIKVDLNDIENSILEAVAGKPLQGTACCNRLMYQIGG